MCMGEERSGRTVSGVPRHFRYQYDEHSRQFEEQTCAGVHCRQQMREMCGFSEVTQGESCCFPVAV